MAYEVNITTRAARDLAGLYLAINAQDSQAASQWYQGLKNSILSLEAQPNRCPLIQKKARLRHFLYGRKPHVYRVIYRVAERKKQVEILHIRHGARQKVAAADLI